MVVGGTRIFKNDLFFNLCKWRRVFVYHGELMEVGGKQAGVGSLLPSCGIQGWSLVNQSGQEEPSPAELPPWC